MKRRHFFKRKRKNNLPLIIFSSAFIIYLLFAFSVSYIVKPVVSAVGINMAKAIAVRVISEAVNEEMKNNGGEYQNLIIFEKNAEGNVTALKSDIVKVNSFNATISQKILDSLSIKLTEISIPMGNFTKMDLLAGRGPEINFKLIPYGAITTDIDSLFTSAGINQTRHRTMLNVDATVFILMAGSTVSANVKTAICISETILVGEVPDNFTNVNEKAIEEMSDIIMDYGTSGN